MEFAKYWAEARRQERKAGKQRTLRRLGWSNLNQAEAQALAQTRVDQAMETWLAGAQPASRERHIAYGAADGVPIREEVLREYDHAVVSRNIYGAHCLNVADVLFADVDVPSAPDAPRMRLASGCLLALGVGIATVWCISRQSFALWLACMAMWLGLTLWFEHLFTRAADRRRAQWQSMFPSQLREQMVAHFPDWLLHCYQTPNGYRLLVAHRTFVASDPDAQSFLSQIPGMDSNYRRLCTVQKCFRARLTGKPWRMKLPPYRYKDIGRWPTTLADGPAQERTQWLTAYDRAAQNYAACRFMETIGHAPEDARCAQIRLLHDDLSHARTPLPLA